MKPPCDEAEIQSVSAERPCSERSGRWILAATILGSSLAFIDGTVVNVALPALQSTFHASVVDVQWIIEGYSLFLAALILVGGSLGDLFGRRRVYIIGVALFAVSSAWCGLSHGVGELILARCVQGVGAALLVPGSLAIIGASFDQKRRGTAIGTWSGATSMTTAIGPVLGGWLIEHASWRWAFFINLPIALAVIVICWWRVPESRSPDANRLDWLGAVLVTLGLAGVVYGLIEAPRLGWRNLGVLASLGLGSLLLLLFFLSEDRAKAPMVPLSLFRSRAFTGANLLTLFLYAALGVFFFLFPLNLIQVQHYSATAAGAAALPMIFLLFLLSRWSGGLVARYGARLPLIVGPLIVALGFALFTLPSVGGSYWKTFFAPFMVLGFGMAVSIAPLTTVVMNSVPASRSGIASGVNNAVSRVASLLSIAVLGIVLLHAFQSSLAKRLDEGNASSSARGEMLANSIDLAATQIPSSADRLETLQLENAVSRSFVFAFRTLMLICSALAIVSCFAAVRWIRIPPISSLPNPPIHPAE